MAYESISLTNLKRLLAMLGALALLNFLDNTPTSGYERRYLQAAEPNGATVGSGKPVMATFFETVEGGCCGMTEQGHQNLLNAWKEAWEANGWETKILTEKDARKHPEFEDMKDKLLKVGVSEYNQRCFWRWLAMAVDDSKDGGWMSD
jgi:hypothetical protein